MCTDTVVRVSGRGSGEAGFVQLSGSCRGHGRVTDAAKHQVFGGDSCLLSTDPRLERLLCSLQPGRLISIVTSCSDCSTLQLLSLLCLDLLFIPAFILFSIHSPRSLVLASNMFNILFHPSLSSLPPFVDTVHCLGI